jgi:hypothetical protein
VLTWGEDRVAKTMNTEGAEFHPQFSGLTKLDAGKGGCCTMDVTAEQVGGGALLQSVLESYTGQGPITVSLHPGTYTLSAPLRLGPEFSGITLQACREGVMLQGPSTPGDEFVHGLITIRDATSVTIRGIELAAPQVRISPSERSFSGLHPRNGHLLREFSRRLHVAIGISVRGSVGLAVDDCTFDLPDPDRVNSFAAGIFTTGVMDDLTITGCTFQVGRAPAADHNRRREPPYAARSQAVVFHNLATGERAEPPYQLAFGYLQVPTLKSDGRGQTRPHSLDGATVERCLFEGLTVPALVIARLGRLRVSQNTVRDAYGGFWLVSLADPQLAVIFDRIAIGEANSYQQISGGFGGAALLDRLLVIATAIGQVLPAAPTGGDGLEFGRILTPNARLLGLARETFSSFCLRATGRKNCRMRSRLFLKIWTMMGLKQASGPRARCPAAAAMPAGTAGGCGYGSILAPARSTPPSPIPIAAPAFSPLTLRPEQGRSCFTTTGSGAASPAGRRRFLVESQNPALPGTLLPTRRGTNP